MLTLRADKPLRVACGLALLLLLAAHEKVCPWLRSVPRADDPERVPGAPASSDDSRPAKRAPKRLPHLLPEVAAPRWPTGWAAGGPRVSGRPGATDDRDPRLDDDSIRLVPAHGPICAWWLDFEPGTPAAEVIAVGVVNEVPADPAIQTCIIPAGPPGVAGGGRTVGVRARAIA